MKKLLILFIIIATLSSCRKLRDVPAPMPASITKSPPANASNPTAPLIMPAISFDIKAQVVKALVINSTLKMTYNERITLLIRTDSLQNSYAVIFNEDLRSTQLRNFNFTSLTKFGDMAVNYIDNNLNNIALNEVKDTTINKTPITKISFNRTLLYSDEYYSNADAIAIYNFLLNTKETLNFSAYITYGITNSSVYKTQSAISYIKL